MKKEIKFSLVFRDMWQSAGKYVPRVDQLVKVAPAIIEMGCFARVETNGGGFEQILSMNCDILYKEGKSGRRRKYGNESESVALFCQTCRSRTLYKGSRRTVYFTAESESCGQFS